MRLAERIRIAVVLSVSILAIGLLTWGVGRIYLELVGDANARKSQTILRNDNAFEQLAASVLILPETKFWVCQIGVFQNQENAYLRQEQLMTLNLETEVFGNGPWAVGIGWADSADGFEELTKDLAAKGIPTVPKQVVLTERSFRVGGNSPQLTSELLTIANRILQEGMSAEVLDQELRVWHTLAGEHPPRELEGMHQIFEQMRLQFPTVRQNVLVSRLFVELERVIKTLSGK